jgi:hypothetical protein
MDRKASSGQIVIEFLILLVCFCVLLTVIKYKVIDAEKKKMFRWEER